MSCDLHIHSTCSDGAVPIERLASIAARTGLHAIALSDHDTLLSAQYAYAHTGQDGVELIPAAPYPVRPTAGSRWGERWRCSCRKQA